MGTKTKSLWVATALILGAGCDESGVGPEGSGRVSLSLTAESAAPASASRTGMGSTGVSAALVPVTDPSGSSIDVQTVQLVFRDVELKRDDHSECDGDDACEKFEVGPVLVTLPLDGQVITPFSEVITPGVYDEIELKLQQPEDDNGDRARFFAEHPDWPRRATVRVAGTYTAGTAGATAQPFDVYLNVVTKVEHDLAPPLVVSDSTASSSLNLTLAVDVSTWFLANNGSLIDPRAISTSPALLAAVTNNVRDSFRALRDDDRDGDDDGQGRGRGRGRGRGGDDGGSDD